MFSIQKHKSFRARLTMKTLLEVALVLIVYSQIYPTLIEAPINTMITTSDSITAALLSLIPFVIAAMLIIGIITFDTVRS